MHGRQDWSAAPFCKQQSRYARVQLRNQKALFRVVSVVLPVRRGSNSGELEGGQRANVPGDAPAGGMRAYRAMASVLTFWCQPSQCEVTTGLWVDAEGLQRLVRQGRPIRCFACGQEHPIKDGYLKPHPTNCDPIGLAGLYQRRDPKDGAM